MVKELILMCGLPGSLKTTMAKKLLRKDYLDVTISDDALRLMLLAGEYTFGTDADELVHDGMLKLTSFLMCGGCDRIVIDEPNITRRRRSQYIDLGKHFGRKSLIIWCVGDQDNTPRRMSNPRGFNEEHWQRITNTMAGEFCEPTTAEADLLIKMTPQDILAAT